MLDKVAISFQTETFYYSRPFNLDEVTPRFLPFWKSQDDYGSVERVSEDAVVQKREEDSLILTAHFLR